MKPFQKEIERFVVHVLTWIENYLRENSNPSEIKGKEQISESM